MEVAFPYLRINYIVYLAGVIAVPILLAAIKIKAQKVHLYEWLVLLMPLIIFRLIYISQVRFKSDGNIALEPLFVGVIISCVYVARYCYRESHARVAPLCFGLSCLVPVVVYICMPIFPN
jgi:hypothetical protein